MFNEGEYFYCYSTNLFKYLKIEKEINYICCGLNENTKKKFWQFKRTEELEKALTGYRIQGKEFNMKNGINKF